MKIAFIHDFLTQYGGAERLLETVVDMFSDSECHIYTLRYFPTAFPLSWRRFQIRSVAFPLPFIDFYPQFYAPYLVSCIESIDLRGYDFVFSSDLIFAKCVICPVGCPHISYWHTPAFALYPLEHGPARIRGTVSFFTLAQKSFLRMKEFSAVARIDRLLTNSFTTAARIEHFFHRVPDVVYSFVHIPSLHVFQSLYRTPGDYFLCISRLVEAKRIDLAIAACSSLGFPLRIIGDGPFRMALQAQAGHSITFCGYVDDDEKLRQLGGCRALIIPGCEDFGLTALEAMAIGKPVIAFGRGGVTETVVAGATGLFFSEQHVDSLVAVLQSFDDSSFASDVCRRRAEEFSYERFVKRIKSVVDEVVMTH